MKVGDTHYRSIWYDRDKDQIQIIDQRWLPHDFRIATLETLDEFATAIREMWVRGAPLIGATAAFGLARELARDPSDASLETATATLMATRPTAVNLAWALNRCNAELLPVAPAERAEAALSLALAIADEDVAINKSIGTHGLDLIRKAAEAKQGEPVRILTHCNAGWIATVDWGTATSPVYQAVDEGLPVHVWVDETRPRNQGALTAWELGAHGVSHAYITDNAGGHLMQRGLVDMVIVGTDRTTHTGDVCNKIGTYLKALAARDNDVPFYVALPSPTIDWTLDNGHDIPIEGRPEAEVTHILGSTDDTVGTVRVTPEATPAENPAFDVTPARLVTGLITERGICAASKDGLAALFPEHARP